MGLWILIHLPYWVWKKNPFSLIWQKCCLDFRGTFYLSRIGLVFRAVLRFQMFLHFITNLTHATFTNTHVWIKHTSLPLHIDTNMLQEKVFNKNVPWTSELFPTGNHSWTLFFTSSKCMSVAEIYTFCCWKETWHPHNSPKSFVLLSFLLDHGITFYLEDVFIFVSYSIFLYFYFFQSCFAHI